MKVWKNKNMPEWNPENGTHYQHLSILDYFRGEPFRKHKMDYCNTCIKIVAESK